MYKVSYRLIGHGLRLPFPDILPASAAGIFRGYASKKEF
jgi:hypothetical protein